MRSQSVGWKQRRRTLRTTGAHKEASGVGEVVITREQGEDQFDCEVEEEVEAEANFMERSI